MTEDKNNEFHNVVPLQIRFNDVDKFGHVNNTIYFQFYDSGKTDYVSTVCKGFDWDQYAIFVVKIEVEFFAQIKGTDRIAVRTRTVKLGNKSFHLENLRHRYAGGEEPLPVDIGAVRPGTEAVHTVFRRMAQGHHRLRRAIIPP